MRRPKFLLFVIVLCASTLAVACGTEVARIPFSDVGTGETEVDVESGGKVDLWTDLDVATEGDFSLASEIVEGPKVGLVYSVSVHQSGALVEEVSCDALDVSVFHWKTKLKMPGTSLRTSRSAKYLGKMKCALDLPDSGPTRVEAALELVNLSDDPSTQGLLQSYRLTKADLVVKR